MKKADAKVNAGLIEKLAYMQGFKGDQMNGIVLIAHTAAHAESESIYPTDIFHFAHQRGILDRKMCEKRGYINAP